MSELPAPRRRRRRSLPAALTRQVAINNWYVSRKITFPTGYKYIVVVFQTALT